MTSRILLPAICVLFCTSVAAQVDDADLKSLALSRQYEALEKLARQRLARDPDDENSLWYLAEQSSDDPDIRATLLPSARHCAKHRPQAARCESALGLLIGAEIEADGGFSALLRIGEVRVHFERAVALAPEDYAMRRDLQGFYIEVPGFMGGSHRKAAEQADAVARVDAQRGHLMKAELAIGDKSFDAAERELLEVRPYDDLSLERDEEAVQVDLGSAFLDAGLPARAQAWFERLVAHDSTSADAFAGLGRALLATSQPTAAAQAFENAVKLNPRLHIQHLLASAYEAAGQHGQAIDAYRLVLGAPAEHAYADHARERLAALQR